MFRYLKASLLFSIVCALITAGVAWAHADQVRSNPAPNSTLDAPPARVTVWFSEPVEPGFSTITVLYEDGSTADAGNNLVSPADQTQLSVSLKETRNGTYIVSWRALSAVDGHLTSGSYVFSVGEPIERGVGSPARSGAITSPVDMLARALAFIGQATLVGVILFRWLAWLPALKSADLDEEVDSRAIARNRRVVYIALGLAAAGAVITLLVQSSLAGTTIGGWLSTRVGRIWIGRVATLVGLGVLADDIASIGRRRDRQSLILSVAVGWLGLQLLLTTTLTSHSATVTDPPVLPIVADWLHLTGTALWVGGLAQMAFVVPAVARTLDPEDRSWLWLKTVVYFSTVAAAALGILIITGAFMSALHVGGWPAVLGTAYGQSLLFKLGLAGIAMLLGAYNLFVVKPKLDKAVDAPDAESSRAVQSRFRRVVAIEASVALAALASAGILTDLPRSIDPQPVAEAQQLELTTRAEDLDVGLRIEPGLTGDNTFDVRLSDASGGAPISDAESVTLRFTYLGRNLGTTEAEATLTGDGTYSTRGAYLSLSGDWQIEAAVRRPGAFDVFAAYRLTAGLDSRIQPAGGATVVDSLARWLSIYGLAFGGFAAIGLGLAWIVIAAKAARNQVSQAALMIPSLIALPIGALSVLTFFREATPGLALTNPYLPDEQSLAIGQKLYVENCAVCHGEAGRGDGSAAATLPIRPADFGSGHLDIHTDGDIFYWIQNGLPIDNSPMPAFGDELSDEEIWHLTNYVRRLRNRAGETASNAPQPIATPPLLVTPSSGVETPQVITASGSPEALALLSQSDEAMNALASLVEKQTLRDDAGNQLSIVFTYAAPDRLRYQIVNGVTSIQIGLDDYQLGPDGNWIKNRRALPFEWPNFSNAKLATGAAIEGEQEIEETTAQIVGFQYGGYDFKLWIDTLTHYILRLTMDGPGHHMDSVYSDFDSAPEIEQPIP